MMLGSLCAAALFIATNASATPVPAATADIHGKLDLSAARGEAKVTWEAPTDYVQGNPFDVKIRVEAPADGAPIANWLLTPAAFTIDGKALANREGGQVVSLAPGTVLTLAYDLAPALQASQNFAGKDFELGFAKEYLGTEPIAVRVFLRAPEGIDFMTIPVAELASYQVLIETNRGAMRLEFFPDKAPKHVRNFLDLCASGFYVDTLFHRVSPTFMIQGGCPNTKQEDQRGWGSGDGPRRLDAEFNDVKHVRGILSMARSNDPNSASCQFFVMCATANFLDGSYSAFGRMVSGDETLTRIASAKGLRANDGTSRPSEPQQILRTTVIRAAGAGGAGAGR
jgi:peptidyl-prolyl cis-trans isomerase B (cyclophilin B)